MRCWGSRKLGIHRYNPGNGALRRSGRCAKHDNRTWCAFTLQGSTADDNRCMTAPRPRAASNGQREIDACDSLTNLRLKLL